MESNPSRPPGRNRFAEVREQCAEQLTNAKAAEDLKATVRWSLARIDETQSEIFSQGPVKVACEAGCSFCCHLRVPIHAGEAFVMVDYVRKSFSEAEQRELIEKARATWEKIKPLASSQRGSINLPCPFLKANSCSIYSARPSACRAFFSRSVQSCRDAYEKPVRPGEGINEPVPDLEYPSNQVAVGVSEAFTEAGFDTEFYELSGAFLMAFKDAGTEKRWARGKNAFSSVVCAKGV